MVKEHHQIKVGNCKVQEKTCCNDIFLPTLGFALLTYSINIKSVKTKKILYRIGSSTIHGQSEILSPQNMGTESPRGMGTRKSPFYGHYGKI